MLERYVRNLSKFIPIPIILLVLSIAIIYVRGVPRGVDFLGGVQATIKTTKDPDAIARELSGILGTEVRGRSLGGGYVSLEIAGKFESEQVKSLVGKYGEIVEVAYIGPALGASFWKQAKKALPLAFAIVGIVVFLQFRKWVPSFMMVTCIAFDFIEALAGMSILGIPLNLPTFAALLMLIGYSIDTDILLTNRALRMLENLPEAIASAMRTGLMMTGTTLIAIMALFMVTGSIVLRNIAMVLLVGLLADIINTWITNAWLIYNFIGGRKG